MNSIRVEGREMCLAKGLFYLLLDMFEFFRDYQVLKGIRQFRFHMSLSTLKTLKLFVSKFFSVPSFKKYYLFLIELDKISFREIKHFSYDLYLIKYLCSYFGNSLYNIFYILIALLYKY